MHTRPCAKTHCSHVLTSCTLHLVRQLLSHFTGEETETQEVESLPLFPLMHSQSILFLGNFNCEVVNFNCEVSHFLEFDQWELFASSNEGGF